MKISDLTQSAGEWLRGNGPMSEIVISSRIRLARNIAGLPFLSRCTRGQRTTLERLRVDLAELVGDAERRTHELETALAARERRLRTLVAETGRVEVELTAPPRLAIDPAEARLLRNLQDGYART